jgi:hypothetical protein
MKPFRLTSPQLRENDIESACLDLLRIRGYFVVRNHAGTFKTLDGRRFIKGAERGTPDYAALHKRFPAFLLETKRPKGELADIQAYVIQKISIGYGIPTATVKSARELLEWLEAHERKEAGRTEGRPAHRFS